MLLSACPFQKATKIGNKGFFFTIMAFLEDTVALRSTTNRGLLGF